MTEYTFRTMIVPASLAPLARALAAGLSPEAGAGMWEVALAPEGAPEPTYYISTGMIDEQFVGAVSDAGVLYAACQAAGAGVTLEQCQALVSGSDVSDDSAQVAMGRLGLVTWRGEA